MDYPFVVKAPAGQEYHRARKHGRHYITPCGRSWSESRVRPLGDRTATCRVCLQHRAAPSDAKAPSSLAAGAERLAERITHRLSQFADRMSTADNARQARASIVPFAVMGGQKRSPLRILLDLDGTILVNAGPMVAQEEFGIDMSDVSDHRGILARLQQHLGWTEEQFWDWWRERESYIYSRGIVMPHAVETLYRLRAQGAYIHIVTARHDTGAEATLQWLKRHDVPYDAIRFNNSGGKVQAALEHQLNLAFEDEPRFIQGLRKLMPVITLDAPANREIRSGNGVYKVSSWQEVPGILMQLGCWHETA